MRHSHTNDPEKFKVIRRKGKLYFDHGGWTYDLSPPEFVSMILPPNISGVDAFLEDGAKAKGITGDFLVSFSPEWFIGCDAKADYLESFLEGWIYEVKYGGKVRKAWVCPHMRLIFDSPPKIMHLSIEA